ncbi:hypothetical protein ACFX2I_014220 [Malus domestica]
MAQVSIARAFFFVQILVLAVLAATVFSQETAPAPAPMDGAAYSLPVNGAVVGASLMVSFFALLKHYVN